MQEPFVQKRNLARKKLNLYKLKYNEKTPLELLSDEEIDKEIYELFERYCNGVPNSNSAQSHCDEVESALEKELKGIPLKAKSIFT